MIRPSAKAMRRLLPALLLLFGSLVLSAIAPADQLEVRSPANVYAEPDRKSDHIQRLDPADYRSPLIVNLLDGEKVNGYYHIQLPGSDDTGWIYKTFVRRISGEAASGDASRSSTFTSSSGRKYNVTPAPESPEDQLYSDLSEADMYEGTDRKDAKTSYPDKPTSNLKVQKLDALLASLKPDDFMRKEHQPKIAKNSKRVAEENVIVKVKAFLYASKKEEDNDFHLILSTDPEKGDIQYMTAEITGIPEEGPYKEGLIKPRRTFKEYLANKLPKKKYVLYDPAIPVEVAGPLFFDVDHPAGKVGPDGHRPDTAWEIHPVMDIRFLQ